jgi:hypothetical protein
MNARNTPAQKASRNQAAQAKFRQDLADFKKFVAFHIGQLERGQPVLIIVNVVEDPCCPPKLMFATKMISGPPA